jgi:hypothetical protein
MALTFVQAQPPSPAQETTGAATKAEKKAKKAKKNVESTGETTTQPGAAATGVSPATETPTTKKGRTATAGSAQRAATTASESEIAAAKASGKVWVNTATGVYHKEGRWYGNTKEGKFMTEQEAVKAGYRPSKGK